MPNAQKIALFFFLGAILLLCACSGKYMSAKHFNKIATIDTSYIPIVATNKMNVFYAGVDNPITAGITGIPASQITASITGCDATITPTEPGKYVVRAKSAGKATITLTGKNKKGKLITQARDFRVKYIPDPTPVVCCKGGHDGSGEWKAIIGVRTELKDFDFDVSFNVVSFNMTLIQKNDTLTCRNKGAVFEGFCRELQQRARVNSIYIVDSIMVIGPDERLRNLGEVSFKIR
jgi:gliding motility-associated protein GldM